MQAMQDTLPQAKPKPGLPATHVARQDAVEPEFQHESTTTQRRLKFAGGIHGAQHQASYRLGGATGAAADLFDFFKHPASRLGIL